MAKPKYNKLSQQKRQSTVNPVVSIPPAPVLSVLSSYLQQTIFIVFVGFVIYFNSFNNKYALDDDIVMRLNDYVQQGVSGIGKIMTTDAYDSFFKSMGSSGELSGGRYRPLSMVTFAVEQQLFGECYGNRFIEVKDSITELSKNPMANAGYVNKLIAEKVQLESKISQSHESVAKIRHIVSVLLYILSAVLLLKLLRDYIFKYANLKFVNHQDLAFLTTIIF